MNQETVLMIESALGTTRQELIDATSGMISGRDSNPELIRIGLTTATFYRGDGKSIVPAFSKFDKFEYGYDEFLASLDYLRSVHYDFMVEASFVEGVNQLFAERVGKTIVYIPPVRSVLSVGTKHADVTAILKAIAGSDTPIIENKTSAVMRVKRGDRWVRVVNLVEERNRETKKNAIFAAHKSKSSDDLDVIITLGMFKEGANWKYADREIIIGERFSITESVQTVGRLFRDVLGKQHVEIIQILPLTFERMQDISKEEITLRKNALYFSLMLENVLNPVVYDDEAEKRKRVVGEYEYVKPINYLREAILDEVVCARVLNEIGRRVIDVLGSTKFDIEEFRYPYGKIVADVLTAEGVHEYHEEIAEQVLRMFDRATKTYNRLNVDRVETLAANPFDCLVQFSGAESFKALRDAEFEFVSFDEARAFAVELKINSSKKWWVFAKSGLKPDNIPFAPNKSYEGQGWIDWGHFLGTNNVSNRDKEFVSFDEARDLALSLKCKGQRDWIKYCTSGKKPDNVPVGVDRTYKDYGWKGWSHFLGHTEDLCYEEARAFVMPLKIEGLVKWNEYCVSGKKPDNIPSAADKVYKDHGWIGWGHFLGTGRTRNHLSYDESSKWVQSLGTIRTGQDWKEYAKSGLKPANIPATPNEVYKDNGWIDWGHFLGTGRTRNHHLSYDESSKWVQSLGTIRTFADWRRYCESGLRPLNIPSRPERTYKDSGWISWAHWLGSEKKVKTA